MRGCNSWPGPGYFLESYRHSEVARQVTSPGQQKKRSLRKLFTPC